MCEEFEVVEHNQFLFSVFPTLTSSAGLIPQMISDMIFAVSPRSLEGIVTVKQLVYMVYILSSLAAKGPIKTKWPIWKISDVLRALALW